MVNSISCPPSKDDDSLKDKQAVYTDIAQVSKWVASGIKPNSEQLSSYSQFIKGICAHWDALEIRDDVLFRKKTCKNGKVLYQAVLPYSKRRTVLSQFHDERTSAHLGFRKTLEKVKLKFYWHGLQKDVKQYIAGCEKCQWRKAPTTNKKAPMQVVTCGTPLERIATDILGELPMSTDQL